MCFKGYYQKIPSTDWEKLQIMNLDRSQPSRTESFYFSQTRRQHNLKMRKRQRDRTVISGPCLAHGKPLVCSQHHVHGPWSTHHSKVQEGKVGQEVWGHLWLQREFQSQPTLHTILFKKKKKKGGGIEIDRYLKVQGENT